MNQEPATVEPIMIEIEVPVPPDRAWQAVTDPAEVTEWFADVTPVDGIGSPYGIDFGDGSAVEGRVKVLDPGRRVAYSWAWAGEDGGPVTLVTWEVEPRGEGGSLIRLTHDGWSEAGADAETRDDHADYWDGYLDELREMLGAE